ncbi:unnamed protein product [Adineta ricciae]|uniref:NAD(P)(+)--arginine ADP-ribosyltransferase n=1 Tax=Adineta ricciae TaxID=249248 RepID=A0A815PP54_ADIRI|nr:unnamed protein product [Adineta ricciae]
MIRADEKESAHQGYHYIRILDAKNEPLCNLLSIDDIADVPIVSLEDSIEPLRAWSPMIRKFALYLKYRCSQLPPDGLTVDESAAIMFYTTGWSPLNECLYVGLNEALRSKDREKLKPWYSYLKILLTALARLPPVEKNIYCGLKSNLCEQYTVGETYTWRGITSCSTLMNILTSWNFSHVEADRIMFNIKCKSARNITNHSTYKSDDEFVLLPGTQFKCQGYFDQGNNFRVYELEEISPPSILDKLATTKAAEKEEATTVAHAPLEFSRMQILQFFAMLKRKRWVKTGSTVAGGNGLGKELNQLFLPVSFCMDKDKMFYIADTCNNRIMKWKCGGGRGRAIAGDVEGGKGVHQLERPSDIVLDPDETHIDICDAGNRRIIQWSRQGGTQGKILFSNFDWQRLTVDKNGYFYLSDDRKSEITRWKINTRHGTSFAGGNAPGSRLDQLNNPTSVFLDPNFSIYISDTNNHRVLKWSEGAKEGVLVAGGNGEGSRIDQLANPRRIFVDSSENVYIADTDNHRIICWLKGDDQGYIVAGGNGEGDAADQLRYPKDFLFDRNDNLYVLDSGNHRIQLFSRDYN